jgi:hypothetical protein
MVNITINGREFKAEKNATILDVARDRGIYIPTLCFNESLGPEGRCRLCMVEITQGKRTRMVTSCLFPVEEGLQVQTETEKEASVQARQRPAEVHPLRSLRQDLRRGCGCQRHWSFEPGNREKSWDPLYGACDGLHRVRSLPFHLSHQRDPNDRERRGAQHLGTEFQAPGMPGLRQPLRSRIPAGVDGTENRRFPGFPPGLSGLPEITIRFGIVNLPSKGAHVEPLFLFPRPSARRFFPSSPIENPHVVKTAPRKTRSPAIAVR